MKDKICFSIIAILLIAVVLLTLKPTEEYNVDDYDYWLARVISRELVIDDEGLSTYEYYIAIRGGEYVTMYSTDLFSVDEYVLIVEISEEESVLLDFGG